MRKTVRFLCALLVMTLALGGVPAYAAIDANFNETGYPIVNEPITLTIMGARNAAVTSAWSENFLFKKMEELTNIKLEYNDVDSSSWNEKLNLALASGDLPDMITKCNLSTSVVKENLETGYFIPLNDLIDRYAPNFKALYDSSEDIRKLVTLPDGTIPGLMQQANLVTEDTTIMPTQAMMVYQPWLDALGLAMPTTTEEYYEVLKAFKTGDPNGNGIADEIPLCPLYGQSGLDTMLCLFNMSSNMENYCSYTDGKVVFLPLTDDYKDFLAYFNRLYTEGLLDSEVFTQNQQQVLAKGSDAVPLIGSSVASGPAIVVGDARAAEMSPMPILASPSGERTWARRPAGYKYTFVITSANKYPEASMRWIDYFYSEEGAILAWMGIEGESFKWNDDGTWAYIVGEGESTNSVRAKYCIQPGGGLAAAFPLIYYTKTTDPSEILFRDYCLSYVDEPGEAELLLPQYPSVVYDEMVQKELTTYATDITSYVKQMMAKFIVGEASVENDWAEYEQTLKRMNLDEMVRIMQEACDAL